MNKEMLGIERRPLGMAAVLLTTRHLSLNKFRYSVLHADIPLFSSPLEAFLIPSISE